MRALITQRETADRYGELTDVLEARYIQYFAHLGIEIWPVSNFLTEWRDALAEFDALILTGGGDLPAPCYREVRAPKEQLHRDRTERLLVERFQAQDKPILAICRGMQYINGLRGGKISRLDTLQVPRPVRVDHPVEIMGEEWLVNQYHNDGIFLPDLVPGLEVLAVDRENGVVEAFVDPGTHILALQWHPERPFADSRSEEKTRALICGFLGV